ncbi:MAG: bile acid:sodium symporter [Opitutales bacterium]|nr:bile acid:sodium symporter [Opitutales bacterium]
MEIERQLLSTVDQALLLLMILIIMFGMGASLTTREFGQAFARPRAFLIGFLSQFGLMPLLAFSLALLLQLPPALAIALILIGCLPGGSTSNMFAYFARGAVALSISMTAASTLLALIMMPILLDLYASGFAEQIQAGLAAEDPETTFIIPTGNIIISLILVLVPVGLGMILRHFSAGWAKTAEDTAGFFGIIVILFLILSVSVRHGGLFFRTPVEIYVAAVGIGLTGFTFGYLMAKVFRLPYRHRRTISLETGIQNGPIAFAIILLSFSQPWQNEMLWLAVLYSTFIVITSSLVTLWYRRIGAYDYEVHRNEVVHQRLFGKDYQSPQPRDNWLKGRSVLRDKPEDLVR